MNKDTPVLQFTIKDVLGVSSINIDKGFTKVVPLSFIVQPLIRMKLVL